MIFLFHQGVFNKIILFIFNFFRGAGYTFGIDIVQKFLEINNMEHILRAHQLCHEGYQVLISKNNESK